MNNQELIRTYFPVEVKSRLTYSEKKFINNIFVLDKWTDKQLIYFENIIDKYQLQPQQPSQQVIYLPTGYAEGAKLYQTITSKRYRKTRGIDKSKNG